MRTALWQAVKKAHPNLTDEEVNQLMDDHGKRIAQLFRSGMSIHQARELANGELFEGIDPWAGDDQYGPET